jgi:hypothetical protein
LFSKSSTLTAALGMTKIHGNNYVTAKLELFSISRFRGYDTLKSDLSKILIGLVRHSIHDPNFECMNPGSTRYGREKVTKGCQRKCYLDKSHISWQSKQQLSCSSICLFSARDSKLENYASIQRLVCSAKAQP